MYYLKTKDGVEIDLIIERDIDVILIEIRSKEITNIADVKLLVNLSKEFSDYKALILCTNVSWASGPYGVIH